MLYKVKCCLIRFIFGRRCECVCGEPTTPKLKISDLGVTCPLRASGAMYAHVPIILSVIMVVKVPLGEALVNPKSEIFATSFSSKRIFALKRQNESVDILYKHENTEKFRKIPFNTSPKMLNDTFKNIKCKHSENIQFFTFLHLCERGGYCAGIPTRLLCLRLSNTSVSMTMVDFLPKVLGGTQVKLYLKASSYSKMGFTKQAKRFSSEPLDING